jgi:signal peptidase I
VRLSARNRRPAGAVVLTLCVTGLGHLYAGRPRAALAFVLAGHLYGVALLMLTLSRPSAAELLFAVVIGVLLVLTAIVHSSLAAKRAAQPYELRWYNRWWIYVLVLLFAWFVWRPGLQAMIRHSVLNAYRIPSPAMEPSILVGDFLFADSRAAARRMPQRNDVVIFSSLTQPGLTLIKRVIGLPGDTLLTRDGQLYRNGQAVAEPWIRPLTSADSIPLVQETTPVPSRAQPPTMLNWGPVVVPAGQLFVMGDNRPDSYDSRFWGTLPADQIVGRPLSLYFSIDLPAMHIRWDRIGTSPWVVQPN